MSVLHFAMQLKVVFGYKCHIYEILGIEKPKFEPLQSIYLGWCTIACLHMHQQMEVLFNY